MTDKEEFIEYVDLMHRQNLNGREDFIEAFEMGIEAAYEEREKLVKESDSLPPVIVVFMDSYGNAINVGDKIIIESDYNYQQNNGAEAEVLWNETKGLFQYKITNKFHYHQSDFYGIHKFRKLNP